MLKPTPIAILPSTQRQSQYPSYYHPPASANGTYGANIINGHGGKTSTAVTSEHVPTSVMNMETPTDAIQNLSLVIHHKNNSNSYAKASYVAVVDKRADKFS